MKLIRKILDDVKVYDCGITDVFGNKVEVWVNETMESYRLMGRNPYYIRERKRLGSINCNYVYVPRYLEVIDITGKTQKILENLFPDVHCKPQFQVWE